MILMYTLEGSKSFGLELASNKLNRSFDMCTYI